MKSMTGIEAREKCRAHDRRLFSKALSLGGLILIIKPPLPDPMLLPTLFTAILALACIALYLLIRARAEKWAAAMH